MCAIWQVKLLLKSWHIKEIVKALAWPTTFIYRNSVATSWTNVWPRYVSFDITILLINIIDIQLYIYIHNAIIANIYYEIQHAEQSTKYARKSKQHYIHASCCGNKCLRVCETPSSHIIAINNRQTVRHYMAMYHSQLRDMFKVSNRLPWAADEFRAFGKL